MATFLGSEGKDTLHGTSDPDSFVGRGGDDVLYGWGGDDTYLASASGSATYVGGPGSDLVNYERILSGGVSVNLENGLAYKSGSGAYDTFSSIEKVIGTRYNDTLSGDANANGLTGGDGDDTIAGGAGGDTLEGGTGVDTLDYTKSNARVIVDLLNNTATGGHSSGDVISGFENIWGSNYHDRLFGSDDDNFLFGGAGDDIVSGRGGDDTIVGDQGNDTLSGGSGADTFVYWEFPTYSGTDHIKDFNVREGDRIEFNQHTGTVTYNCVFDYLTNTFDVDITLGNAGHVILDDIRAGDLPMVLQSGVDIL